MMSVGNISTGCTAVTLYLASSNARSRACVAGLQAHVDYDGRGGVEDNLHHILMHTCTRWVYNHDVRNPMTAYKLIREYILHVACIEEGIVKTIDRGIQFGILDRLPPRIQYR